MNNEDLRLVLFSTSKMSRIEMNSFQIWNLRNVSLYLNVDSKFLSSRNYQKLKYLLKIRSFRAPDESYRYYNTGKHSERRLVVQDILLLLDSSQNPNYM